MLTDETKKIFYRSIKILYDEHVGNLLRMPEKYLSEILPNKNFPFTDILKSFNKETHSELIRYGEKIFEEISRLINELSLKIGEVEKNEIVEIAKEHCNPNLYTNRFQIFVESTKSKFQSYGMPFNTKNYRIDIPQSICDVDAKNTTRKIISKITNEVEIVQFNSNSQEKENDNIFRKINSFYSSQPFAFWLITIIISIMLGIAAL